MESRSGRTRNILQAGDFTAAVGGQVQVGQLDSIGVCPLGIHAGTVLIKIGKVNHAFTIIDERGIRNVMIVGDNQITSVFHDRQFTLRNGSLRQTVHRVFRLHLANGEGIGNIDDNVLGNGAPFTASVCNRIGSRILKSTFSGLRSIVIGQLQLTQRGAIVTDFKAFQRIQCNGGGVGSRNIIH